MRRLLLVLVVLAAVAPPASPARGQAPGEALLEVCRTTGLPAVPELGPRACVSIEDGATLAAHVCSRLPVPAEACANLTDGHVVDTTRIDAFEGSWAWRALRLQDRLDDAVPLRTTLWPHTHNTSNSTAYEPRLANIDPNQRYSILDQLRMGIRAIELDLHWVPHPAGAAANDFRAVVLCHGRSEGVGDLQVHLGCTVDRLLTEGLAELRAFLDAPGNEDQFVLLYLENQLDDDPVAHDLVATALEAGLGDLVVRPPAGEPCAELPLDRTTDELRAGGGRVVIVGNCGPGGWGTWVHERGERWDEAGDGGSYPAYSECVAERDPEGYDERWTRRYEDSTWLSAMVAGPSPAIDVDDVRAMVRCGVDMIGFDRLEPDDGRLEAFVWSWAPGEPVDDPAKRCVGGDADGRFRMAPCGDTRRLACRAGDGGWVVPATPTVAAEAATACAHVGAVLATPPTGWENERLRAAAGAEPVWLGLAAADLGLDAPTAPPAPSTPSTPDAPAMAAPADRSLPTTGARADGLAPAAALLAVGWCVSRALARPPRPTRRP